MGDHGLKGWHESRGVARERGNADENPNPHQQEAGCRPATLGVASWWWAGGETARGHGDHRVEQDHDLASGAGRVVPFTVPSRWGTHSGWVGGNRTSMTGPMVCLPQRDYPPGTDAQLGSLRPRVHLAGVRQRSASNHAFRHGHASTTRGVRGLSPGPPRRGHCRRRPELAAQRRTKGDHRRDRAVFNRPKPRNIGPASCPHEIVRLI